ncbi:MAG: N-formylglutamate amidohydrolase, partial [Rhodospirillales bacterium]
WQICILWGHDGRIALPLMDNLAKVDGLIVGDNVPYSGQNVAYTVNSHGFANDLPHVGIEIRQDLVSTPEGAKKWAAILLDSLGPVLADPGLYQQRHF